MRMRLTKPTKTDLTKENPVFKLEINTDNSAFDGFRNTEVARILEKAARSLRDGYDSMVLQDFYGNKVGKAEFVEDKNGQL